MSLNRREFLERTAPLLAAGWLLAGGDLRGQPEGDRPAQAGAVRVLNPRNRTPVSFIIDDSTCLANLAHFCIPQFAEVFPDRYRQDWRKLPREIPDAFVRKFGEWCAAREIKGKYSIVPYPACVGWVDRELPGWTKAELQASLKLVREELAPNWDFHPEMVTHTWVIDTKTGRPYPERTARFMENWDWSVGKSADELAEYLAYALRILKNAGLPCEGVTTPGGFGNRVQPALAQATLDAVRDVYQAEIPHYFRNLYTDSRSVEPQVFYASGLDGDDPKCVVSIIGCTGDWFGGWDGLEPGTVDQFITEDLQGGRLPQVIDKGEPAILVCHWPGIYFNGEEVGFKIFQEVHARLHARYDNLYWMKNSEIARYWAARKLTAIAALDAGIALQAPFACPGFTLEIPAARQPELVQNLMQGDRRTALKSVADPLKLTPGTFCQAKEKTLVCFDLPKGKSLLRETGGA